MKNNLYNDLVKQLKTKNVSFDQGLTDEEIKNIESLFKFQIPIDLKNFLQTALPISAGFPNWRAAIHSVDGKTLIENKLNWPYESILSDVKNSCYWNPNWGIQPEKFEGQQSQVKTLIDTAPKLIPIYLHRYIPDQPSQKNNPIFSVYGTDSVVYGNNLAHYLAREFRLELPEQFYKYLNEITEIEFWADMDL